MLLGTAAYFSGLVLNAGLAVSVALAFAVELHGFPEQRRVRALWTAYSRTPDGDAREQVGSQLRAHVGIPGVLVLFQAYNSLQFLGATWRPSPGIVPEPVQLAIHALVLPAAFLVSGALSPFTVDAGDELRHAPRQMLHRMLRATLQQWQQRIQQARTQGVDLAPITVALMHDAGDLDGARRITLIAEGLVVAEAGHAERASTGGAAGRPGGGLLTAPQVGLQPFAAVQPHAVQSTDTTDTTDTTAAIAVRESGQMPAKPPTGPGSPAAVPRRASKRSKRSRAGVR